MKIWEQITEDTWANYYGDCYRSCALQWISKVYGERTEEHRIAIDTFHRVNRLSGHPTNWINIIKWNDDKNRKFPEVQAAFKRADL